MQIYSSVASDSSCRFHVLGVQIGSSVASDSSCRFYFLGVQIGSSVVSEHSVWLKRYRALLQCHAYRGLGEPLWRMAQERLFNFLDQFFAAARVTAFVGLARPLHKCCIIVFIYCIFGRGITNYMVIYVV